MVRNKTREGGWRAWFVFLGRKCRGEGCLVLDVGSEDDGSRYARVLWVSLLIISPRCCRPVDGSCMSISGDRLLLTTVVLHACDLGFLVC